MLTTLLWVAIFGPSSPIPMGAPERLEQGSEVAEVSSEGVLEGPGAPAASTNDASPMEDETSSSEDLSASAEPERAEPVSTAAPSASETPATSIDEPPSAEDKPPGPRRRLTPREKRGRARIGVRWKVAGELGALGVLYHHLQFGKNGTSFDLRRDGRQDTMFLFGRLSTELEVDDHHEIVFLYQPLRIATQTVLMEDLAADDVTFPSGAGLEIGYGFDFYRLSYLYDFFTDPGDEVAVGASLQFRNFRSSYTSTSGPEATVNTNFGPVPALKFRGRHQLDDVNFWYGGEVDAFYANLPFINGGDDPVQGLIVDASLRAGFSIARIVRPFVNVRYLGGGAKGTDSDARVGDGFTENWLHTLAVTFGTEVVMTVVPRARAARDRELETRKAQRRARRRR